MRNKSKTEKILIRSTKEEKERILELAKIHSMSLSDYLRFVGLNATIQVEIKCLQRN